MKHLLCRLIGHSYYLPLVQVDDWKPVELCERCNVSRDISWSPQSAQTCSAQGDIFRKWGE